MSFSIADSAFLSSLPSSAAVIPTEATLSTVPNPSANPLAIFAADALFAKRCPESTSASGAFVDRSSIRPPTVSFVLWLTLNEPPSPPPARTAAERTARRTGEPDAVPPSGIADTSTSIDHAVSRTISAVPSSFRTTYAFSSAPAYFMKLPPPNERESEPLFSESSAIASAVSEAATGLISISFSIEKCAPPE